MRHLRLQASLALLSFAAAGRAQAANAPTQSLSVDVRLVEITAVVRDNKGEPVRGLTRDDFSLREDGKPRTIRYFNADSDLPLTLGLMVDTSSSMSLHAWDEREASASFLEAMVTRPKDRAFLLRFDNTILLLQPATSDVWKLKGALWFLSDTDAHPLDLRNNRRATDTTPPRDITMPQQPDPSREAALHRRPGTLLYDSIVNAAQKVISNESGRRALIILTDGEDQGSRATLDQAIRAAQDADVAVYSVLYLSHAAGPACSAPPNDLYGDPVPDSPGRAVMHQLSEATGGRCFTISKEMPVTHVFSLIEQDMRSQYRLGFTPDTNVPPEVVAPPPLPTRSHTSRHKAAAAQPSEQRPAPTSPQPGADDGYHTLELETRDMHLTVQARTGYYARR